MIFGNVMRNNCYPISVSSERIFQAMAIARYANQIGADAIAHGSTGAGNDQIRFDMTFLVMAPGVEIITLTRDKTLTRREEKICDALKEFNIGNSTIYRLVNSLAEQEKLRCFADGKTHLMNYQYLDVGCQNHLHLKCERCGNVTHLSYEESAAFTDNIYRNHKFDIDIKDTFFYGTCENCADNQ